MLVNTVPAFAPSLLRQCARLGLSSAHTARHLRTFVNSSVQQQSSAESESSSIPWVDHNNKTRSATGLQSWQSIIHTAFKFSKTSDFSSPQAAWDTMEKSKVRHLPPPNNAYSGRTVNVIKGDAGAAFARLKSTLTANAVRATNVRDERHEKKGEKRSRLRSLRWRRRFAHEVRKKVQLVNEIRARGA